MRICNRKRVANSETRKYASARDFCRVFAHDMNVLYRLSFLLTADHQKAEQCFIAGVEDSVNNNRVFRGRARAWAKRIIIQNAVRALNPRPRQQEISSLSGPGLHTIPDRDHAISRVLALKDFERFVFVIAVLEGRSEQECAQLLDCSIQEVRAARLRATVQIAVDESGTITASHVGPIPYAAEPLLGGAAC